MISTAFTEFRKHTAAFLDKVENGDTVVITRHGRPIAEVVAPSVSNNKSWKRKAIRLNIKGACLSEILIADRAKNSK